MISSIGGHGVTDLAGDHHMDVVPVPTLSTNVGTTIGQRSTPSMNMSPNTGNTGVGTNLRAPVAPPSTVKVL